MRIKQFLSIFCLFILSIVLLEAKSVEPQPVPPSPNKEMVVGLYSFDYLREVRKIYPNIIAGHISEKLSCFQNITVLNATAFPSVGKAIEDSKDIRSSLAETVEQGRQKNANKLVTGLISSVEEIYDYRTSTLQLSIILDVGIVDVTTGEMEKSKQLIFQGINATGIAVRIGLKKLGIKSDLITVEDILAITGEKGLTKTIKKSLAALDKELFPFLAQYFGEYDNQCLVEKRGKVSMPNIKIGRGKDKNEVFSVVNKNSDKALLIATNDNKKWNKRTTRFDIITEVEEEDLMGNTIVREILIETAKFTAYSGDYAIIEIPKKSEVSIDEIVTAIKSGDNVFIKYHNNKRTTN